MRSVLMIGLPLVLFSGIAPAGTIDFSVTVSTLAGLAGPCGYRNGIGADALFCSPKGMSVNIAGDIYTVDNWLGTLREITPAGLVTTVSGLAGSFGSADGEGSDARFRNPSGTAVDSAGNIYVADSGNCTLRKVTPAGAVTTLAGVAGSCIAVDGTGSDARFNGLAGVAVDSTDNIYVTGWGSCTIRKVTPAGEVSTIAGKDGVCTTVNGTGTAARFANPSGIAIDSDGNMYVADESGATIRKVTSNGVVTTLAGFPGAAGSVDGIGIEARFDVPSWTAVDGLGNIYVTDYLDDTIRMVTPTGAVSTLAGLAYSGGSTDGTGGEARFLRPDGIAVYGASVYVADRGNNTIRELTVSDAVPEPNSCMLLVIGVGALLVRYRAYTGGLNRERRLGG